MTQAPLTSKHHLKAVRREETTRRLGGHGDNFYMTWAADDRQFMALCDGTGWEHPPRHYYNSRLFSIDTLDEPNIREVSGYPHLAPQTSEGSRYYGFGTLALDGHIFQFLSTLNHSYFHPDGSLRSDLRFVGAKLIYSPDNGRTWHNRDGSTPVIWEQSAERTRETLTFFDEDQESFSLPSILQMGRNYELNRDGFVYVYAPNGNTDGTMNELVMFRVPKGQILNRSAYEFFAGLNSSGDAHWEKSILARKPVHTFPRGWVNTKLHPYAWQPSIVFNAGLGLYLMANWATGPAPDGLWFGKPSYLGFWVAEKPWGPWSQIHEETAWCPAGDAGARAYQSQIAPKWIAPDGKSFWLVWTDFQATDEARDKQLWEEKKHVTTHDQDMQWRTEWHRVHPYYSFNVQRVDLVVT